MSITKTYHGAPCKYGHNGLRYASSRACVTCTLEQADARWQTKRVEEDAGIPPEFRRERERERQAMALRLAAVRAERTAHQRRCLGVLA